MLVNDKSVRNHIPCCATCLRCCNVRDDWNVAFLMGKTEVLLVHRWHYHHAVTQY